MTPDADPLVDAALARQLVDEHFPAWSQLSLTPVEPSGTDHAIFRLGDALAVRLPRVERARDQVRKESRWLPRLAPALPLEVPLPVAAGEPTADYPWPWSVVRWLDGVDARAHSLADSVAAARRLGTFVRTLRELPAEDGPTPGTHNFGRGVRLANRDAATRRALALCSNDVDVRAALAVWEDALDARAWSAPRAWLHGDLLPGNLLVREDRLVGVLDFGGLGVGDPACDLIPGWGVFTGAAREAFRAAVDLDEHAWRRGRGWAISVGAIALPYYRERDPAFAAWAAETLGAAL